MDYKTLLQTIKILISSPAKAWEEISLEQDRQKVFTSFVYPMIGLCAFSVFLGSLITNGWGGPEGFQLAMANCSESVVALFGGCFLSAYAINELYVRLFHGTTNLPLMRQFTGYAMVVIFLITIFTALFTDLTVIGWMLQFYIVYIVWEGVPFMLPIDEKDRFRFTIFASIVLLICPALIHIIFNKLTGLLN